jgi:mono/diheme cytochrome c family protein
MRQENRGKALFMRNCSTCHMKDGNEYFFARRQPILDCEATTRRPTAAT